MSASVLPQLMEVDSELMAQASTLEAQLSELQEKRKGIRTVIEMFESGSAPAAEAIAAAASTSSKATTTKASAAKSAKAKKTKAAAKPAKSPAKTTATKSKVAKAAKEKTTKVKATRGRPAKAKAAEKSTTSKRSGRTANWQKYVQDSYSKSPLPDVIVGVLQAQPNNIFKIADVMNAVFKEDMPKTHFLKARNRVSNILSAGARDGDWFRGRGGTYSVSEKAIKSVG